MTATEGKEYDPWARLAAMPHVEVVLVKISGPEFGFTDGTVIELDYRLSKVQQRCTLEHELTHIDMGHTSWQPSAVEREVDRRVALRLVTIDELIDAFRFTLDRDHAAWECDVTRDTLDDRMRCLTRDERAQIRQATAHHRDAL